jgi:hypothetical protein
MITHRKNLLIGMLAIWMTFHFALATRARETVDHSIYGDLLKSHTYHGLVNYRKFKADEKILDRYLMVLENVRPENLDRQSKWPFILTLTTPGPYI